MSLRVFRTIPVLLATLAALPTLAHAQLQVTYGSKGVQTLSFNGTTLENVNAFSADQFHIWHMKATDLNGNTLQGGQYGWGEVNNGSSWNPNTLTETYNFTWGSISTQFVQSGNTLNLVVTETNYAGSGILFDGAEIYPFALHFPQDPAGFNGYTQYAITTTDPGISAADYGSGVVTAVLPDESKALYTGWKNAGGATYSPMMTSTYPDGIATFFPHNDLPLAPGNTLTYTLSLRFTPEGTAANTADALASYAQTYPSQVTWNDKRIIGSAFLASSPTGGGDITQPGGFPTNPRRYFNDASVDITSAAGLKAFQNRMLTQAANQVTVAKNMNAQGVITWDLEGEQFPQNTSYVCSPDQVAAVAPEMESTVLDNTSAFYGQRLDDAYFKTMTNAGLRVGLCLRPQVFTLAGNGTASQQFLSTNAAIIANLENKARTANSRWGATLFYVDSVVDANGGTLDPAIFQQLATDLPQVLFIPEEFTTRYYAYTAPFYSFIFHNTTGTAAPVYNAYPHAFGVNMVNDASPSLVAQYTPQLTTAVEKGDVLMGHADYWQSNDPTLVSIYAAAGVTGPSTPAQTTPTQTTPTQTTPTQTTPTLSWPTPGSITYGTALGAAQLDATAGVAGSFTYSPALGTVLPAGTQTLAVTFTPANTSAYKATSGSVQLTVAQATPSVSWPTPAGVAGGTALSATQLNATANVPGTFTYAPAAGTVLSSGNNVLSVTFTPTDGTDFKSVTASTTLNVAAQATPAVSWPNPAAIPYGTALSGAQLNATASVTGTFTYSPAAGTVPKAGTLPLTVTFTPSNTNAYKAVTASVTLVIAQGTPTITWPAPAAITAGTALSAAQLNATASVPGTFTYTPSAGATPAPGTTALGVTFTPADSTDFKTVSAGTTLTINAAAVKTSAPATSTPTATASAPATTASSAVNATTTNLVTDPGFELQPSNSLSGAWTAVGPSHLGVDKNLGNAHSGANNGYIWDNSTAWNAVQQTVAVQPNTEYVFSAWVRTSLVAPVATLAVLGKTGTLNQVSFGNSPQYTLQVVRFNSGANTAVTLQIGLQGQNTIQWVQIDDVALRTNLLLDPGFELQSTRSLSSPWTQLGSGQAGVDNNLGNAFTGANNGWIWNNGSDFNAIAQTVAVQPNTTYTFTGWIRSALVYPIGYFSVDGTNSILNETAFGATNGYTQLKVTFNSGSNTSVRVRAGFWGADTVQWIQTDDFTLQQSQ